jgi:uncharacterized delta-60 repeat protein
MSSPDGVNGSVYALGQDSSNRLIAGGLFTTAGGQSSKGLARFFPDGTRDPSFDIGDGVADGTYNYVADLLVLPDDSIIIVGDFGSFDGTTRGNIARIRSDGSLDAHFATDIGADATIRHIEHSGDGGYIIGGNFNHYDGVARSRIAKLRSDGSLDTSVIFNHTFNESEWVDQIEVFTDGGVLAAGDFAPYDVFKFQANGERDYSFDYSVTDHEYVEATLLCSNGKLLIGGTGGTLYRFNADGTYDESFDPELETYNEIYGLSELANDRIVVTGSFLTPGAIDIWNIVVLNDDGSIDTSAIPDRLKPSDWVGPTVIQNETLIFAGRFSGISENDNSYVSYNRIARLNTTPVTNPPNAVYFDQKSITLIEDGSYIPSFNLNIDETPDSPITVVLEVAEKEPADLGSAFPIIPNPIPVPWDGPNHTEVSVRSSTEDWGYQGPRRIVHRIKSVSGDAVIGEPSEIEIILVDKDSPPAVRFAQSHMELVEDGWHQFEPTNFKVLFDSEVEPFIDIQIVKEAETTEIEKSIFVFPEDYFNFGSGIGYDEIDIAADDDGVLRGPDIITLRLVAEEGYEHLIGSPSTMVVRRHDSTSLDGWLILRYPESWNDSNIQTVDTDKDGQPTLLEWLNDSDPLEASDAKYPAALTEHFDKDNQPYFSIRFYYSENKPSYAAVVEKKMQLDAPNWMTVWRSDLDPNFESDLVLQQPSGDLGGWAEIRLSEPMGNSDFVRIRYEKLPAE